MAQPYKTKVVPCGLCCTTQTSWCPRIPCFGVPFLVHKELSKSYREGIDKEMKFMAQPYVTKVLKKHDEFDVDGI